MQKPSRAIETHCGLFERFLRSRKLGLFVGKQAGIVLFRWLAVRTGKAELPEGVNWKQIWGVSGLAGIGFTISLFVSELTVASVALIANAQPGILVASIVSAVTGYLVLRTVLPRDNGSDKNS